MSLTSSQPEVVATILPETVSRRKLPVNFNQNHLEIFQHDLERTIPPSRLLKFHDIRVSSEGLLLKGLRILPESFAFPSELEEWRLRSVTKLLANNYLFRQRRVIDSEVLWITDYWSTGYFHWLTDTLSRLFVVRDRVPNLPLLLPAPYESRDFVKASLKAFAITTVDFIKPNEVVECRSLLMPTHTAPSGHYNDEVIRGVRRLLLTNYGAPCVSEAGGRIYLSRKLAGKRRIVNEDEVVQTLRKHDFQVVHAEELPFERQVELFSRTRYLVSNHGAGLTNMLFMPEGGSVLELRHQTDRIRNWFFILSATVNLNYFYQLCEPQNDDTDPHTADLIVDVEQLEVNLQLLLHKPEPFR